MNLRSVVGLIICVFVSIPAFAGEYRTVEIESLRVTVDSEWSSHTAPGYWPARFDITNLGEDRVIEIYGRGDRWWNTGQNGTSEVRQTLRIKKGDRLRLTVSVPVFGDNDSIVFQIRERGRTLQSFIYAGMQSNKSPDETAALIVVDQASPIGPLAADWLREVPVSGRYGVSAGALPKLDFIMDPARLPSSWLGYTSVRAVFIGPKEWTQLSTAQKDGLLNWTACGGDLFVVDGDLDALIPDKLNRPAGMTSNGISPASYYLGKIRFVTSLEVSEKGLAVLLSRFRATEDTGRSLPANRAPDWLYTGSRGFRLPIPGIEGVPVRSYMAILIVFSVLIGPVNYVYLWRKKRQVLLVLTAPFISIVFLVVLAGYAVLGEGIGISGRAESFTVLDQTTRHAATRASVSLYASGMTPGGGLRFPREMAIFPNGDDGRGSRETVSLDLSESQQFSSGIIRARAPSNFEEIEFRPARERLNFAKSGETVTVVNALGTNIRHLRYRSGGVVYTLNEPLLTGRQATMHAGGNIDTQTLPPKFKRIVDNQEDDTYLAYLERSPFLETGSPKVEERGSFHLLLGYVEGER